MKTMVAYIQAVTAMASSMARMAVSGAAATALDGAGAGAALGVAAAPGVAAAAPGVAAVPEVVDPGVELDGPDCAPQRIGQWRACQSQGG